MEEIYKVTEADLVGDIEGFPIEVVQKMVEHQYNQTGKCRVDVFCDSRDAATLKGGFTWGHTGEGWVFWSDVIGKRNFERFFELYPEKANSEFKLPYQKRLGLTRLQKWYLSHKELLSADVEYLSVWILKGCMTPRELAKAYEELNLSPYFEYAGSDDKESCFLKLLRNAKKEIESARGNLNRFNRCEFRVSMYEYPKDELLRAIIGWIKKNPLVMYRAQRIAFRGCGVTLRVRRLRDVVTLEWEYKKNLGVKKSSSGSIYLINGEMYEIY